MGSLLLMVGAALTLAATGITIILRRVRIAAWYADVYSRTTRDARSPIAKSFTPGSMAAVGVGLLVMAALVPTSYLANHSS